MSYIENISVNKLADNHWQTYTDIIIDAPLKKVWEVITNWENLGKWSSSLHSITGEFSNHGRVLVTYLVDSKKYETPHLFILKELDEFGWSDPMEGPFIGLTDNHRFKVERISENQTRFIQSDDFKGQGNENMSAEQLANITVQFFPALNRELKKEVEKTL